MISMTVLILRTCCKFRGESCSPSQNWCRLVVVHNLVLFPWTETTLSFIIGLPDFLVILPHLVQSFDYSASMTWVLFCEGVVPSPCQCPIGDLVTESVSKRLKGAPLDCDVRLFQMWNSPDLRLLHISNDPWKWHQGRKWRSRRWLTEIFAQYKKSSVSLLHFSSVDIKF